MGHLFYLWVGTQINGSSLILRHCTSVLLYLHVFSFVLLICHCNIYLTAVVSCMMQGMFPLSRAPSTTSHLVNYIMSIFHYLRSPLKSLCGFLTSYQVELIYLYCMLTIFILFSDIVIKIYHL